VEAAASLTWQELLLRGRWDISANIGSNSDSKEIFVNAAFLELEQTKEPPWVK